jgi:molecular chaperone DnaJ
LNELPVMNFRDHYAILGILPSASQEEIKKAYRLLALQYHPDKTGGDPYAAVQFEAIKEAYEVLTNPRKKELYLQQRWYGKAQVIKRQIQ